mmetsp:Transcript_29763/g.76998  ORF Transcript_29763/g.76998 Transcript_29763/m.76998 type:complete len:202 (-) Transcript_29763:708-1313(-)
MHMLRGRVKLLGLHTKLGRVSLALHAQNAVKLLLLLLRLLDEAPFLFEFLSLPGLVERGLDGALALGRELLRLAELALRLLRGALGAQRVELGLFILHLLLLRAQNGHLSLLLRLDRRLLLHARLLALFALAEVHLDLEVFELRLLVCGLLELNLLGVGRGDLLEQPLARLPLGHHLAHLLLLELRVLREHRLALLVLQLH